MTLRSIVGEVVWRDSVNAGFFGSGKLASCDSTTDRALMDTKNLSRLARGQGVLRSRDLSGVRCPVDKLLIHDM